MAENAEQQSGEEIIHPYTSRDEARILREYEARIEAVRKGQRYISVLKKRLSKARDETKKRAIESEIAEMEQLIDNTGMSNDYSSQQKLQGLKDSFKELRETEQELGESPASAEDDILEAEELSRRLETIPLDEQQAYLQDVLFQERCVTSILVNNNLESRLTESEPHLTDPNWYDPKAVGIAIAGIDTHSANKIRKFLNGGRELTETVTVPVLYSLAGISANWAHDARERFHENLLFDIKVRWGSAGDREFVALATSLTGIDGERADQLREKLGLTRQMQSLQGQDILHYWDWRDHIFTKAVERNKDIEPYMSYLLLKSIDGLDSDKAWDLREKYWTRPDESVEGRGQVIWQQLIISGLIGLDNDRAWEYRESCKNEKGKYRSYMLGALLSSVRGIPNTSPRARELREQAREEGDIQASYAGVDGASLYYGGPDMVAVRKARRDKYDISKI